MTRPCLGNVAQSHPAAPHFPMPPGGSQCRTTSKAAAVARAGPTPGGRHRTTGPGCRDKIPPHITVSPGGSSAMATFITTLHFTEQGIKAVRDTCDRAAAFKATAKKMGVKVTGIYWTLGVFDGVIVCEAPDEATATAALLHLGSLGNIRTQTARAFDAAEMQKILGLLPK